MKRIQITQTGQLRTRSRYGDIQIDNTILSNTIHEAVKSVIGEDEYDDECCAAVNVTIDILTKPLKVELLGSDTALSPFEE